MLKDQLIEILLKKTRCLHPIAQTLHFFTSAEPAWIGNFAPDSRLRKIRGLYIGLMSDE
jgi:hypothetical protein